MVLHALFLLALATTPESSAAPDPASLLATAAIHETSIAGCAEAMHDYARFFEVCTSCELAAYGNGRFDVAIERCAFARPEAPAQTELIGIVKTVRAIDAKSAAELLEAAFQLGPEAGQAAYDLLAGRAVEVLAKSKADRAPQSELLPVKGVCVVDPDADPGLLTVNAKPWAKIFVNGKFIGETPISKKKVPSGCIEIRAVSATTGVEKIGHMIIHQNKVSIMQFMLE